MNGLTYAAPAFAAIRHCTLEKHSVTLVLMPASARRRTATIPASSIGIFTTMLSAILASSLPSRTMLSASTATTSADTGPSTREQISLRTSRGSKSPACFAKSDGLDPRDVLKENCSLVEGPVSAEVVAVDADSMEREGKALAKIADNIVVKIPMLEAGMVAVRRLAEAGIKTNVTLCFSSVQCLIAAKAGAAYVSPFIGRLDDVGQEGMDVIREARVIFDNYQIATEILAASIRHPRHVVDAALIGAAVAPLPPDALTKLLLHPLTDRGLDQFLADWSKLVARAKAAV